MPVPNSFANVTTSIPLSQLDANFNTPITLGNTAIQLGNTVTTLNNMTLANATVSSGNVTVTSASVSGNLTFTSTGQRILGDFSNATFANRVMFQTSTVNGVSVVSVIPNGTGTATAFHAFNNSDPTNAARAVLQVSNAEVIVSSGITGTGTYLPMAFYTGGSERMRIDTSGNVGIGTSSPSKQLYVYTASNSLQIQSVVRNANSGTGVAAIGFNAADTSEGDYTQAGIGLQRGVANGSGSLCFYNKGSGTASNFTTADEKMRITSGGEVYIAGTTDQGAYNLQCNGTGVWGAGAYVNGSDERIKEDIAPITSGLNVVTKLNPVTYRYKEDWSKDQSIQTGFIAQELLVAMEGQNYVDGVVQQGGSEGYYSVAYQNIIPLLTKAIQEQQAMIDELKAKVAKLEGAK